MPSITGASRLAAIMTLDLRPFLKNTEIAKTKLYQFQQQAQAIGSGTLRTIALGFGLVGLAAIDVAKDFNEIESQLRAIGGRDNIDKVIDQARELGRTTKFTSTEVVTLGLELRKLGFDAERVTGAMTTATKLSQLFGGDLSKVGITIAEVQRQFKGANGELRSFEDIGDIFAVAFKESALDITNLGGALKNVGTVANQSGLTLEKTVALLGGLANSGQKAERAGTRLKTTLIRLGREFGFTEDQTDLLVSGALDTAQIFDLLKNRAGLAGAVISQSGGEIAILEERLLDARGALEAMSQGLEGELFISVAKVKAGFEDMAITLGDALAPYVESVSNYVGDLAKAFEGLSPITKDNIAQLTILAVVLPVVTALIAGLVAGVLALSGSSGIGLAAAVLSAMWLDSSIKAAKYKKEQEDINKAFAQFRTLTEGEDGGFSLDNLGISTTQALEQVLKNQETAIESATLRLARVSEKVNQGPQFTIGETGFDRAVGSAERLNGLKDEEKKLERELNNLTMQRDHVLAELEKREDRLKDLAEERLKLAEKYADSLGFSNELVFKFQKSWEGASDSIAAALAKFGFAVDDLEVVRDKIDQIRSLSLTDILEGGVPKDLLEGLDTGTLEDQKKLAEALVKEIEKIGVEAAEAGAVDFAKYWEEASRSYEAAVKKLAARIELKGIVDARREAIGLAESMKELGLSTEDAYLKSKLTAYTSELEGLLGMGYSETGKTVVDLTKKIEDLNKEIGELSAKNALEKALGAPADVELYAQNFGIFTKSLAGLASLETARLKSDLDAIYANFNDPNGTKTVEDLEKAIRKWLQALDAQEFLEEKEKIDDALKDLVPKFKSLNESIRLGDLNQEDAANERINLLREEIDLLEQRKILTGEESKRLKAARVELQQNLAIAKDFENAAGITSFFQTQISFLGGAFLAAAQNGEDFFTVLKKSFLDTFYALVAKLITLIALYGILAVVSGGASAGAGGIKGAAAAAMGENFGSFLGTNLTGVNRSLAVGSSSASTPGSDDGSLKVMGAVSGNNLVIMNQRGKRAFDRTFG